MNRETYIARMIEEFGDTREMALDNIWIAPSADRADLTQVEFNFVPVGGGLYEIWSPDGRDGYIKLRVSYGGEVFRGTLEEAYDFVFEETKWSIENSPTAQRLIAERRAAEGQ